jgi:hypothetical protein
MSVPYSEATVCCLVEASGCLWCGAGVAQLRMKCVGWPLRSSGVQQTDAVVFPVRYVWNEFRSFEERRPSMNRCRQRKQNTFIHARVCNCCSINDGPCHCVCWDRNGFPSWRFSPSFRRFSYTRYRVSLAVQFSMVREKCSLLPFCLLVFGNRFKENGPIFKVRVNKSFFTSPSRRWPWGLPCLLSIGYRGIFPRG